MLSNTIQAWRSRAQADARHAAIDPREVDWLLKATSDSWGGSCADQARLGDLATIEALWQRRLQERCPVQYLVGKAYWRHYELVVSPAVLIPRPETELIVELVQASGLNDGLWADLGTGSGAIALGLAEIVPQVIAVDCSDTALAIAATNIAAYNRQAQVELRQGSWFEPIAPKQLQGMVSNPPYIPTHVWASLEPEVRCHEPRLALDGGETGLEAIATLVQQAPRYIVSGGYWLVEVMYDQAATVVAYLETAGHYRDIQVFADLAGIDRFVAARLR